MDNKPKTTPVNPVSSKVKSADVKEVAKKPVAKASEVKKSVEKKPAAKKPVAKKPIAKKPAVKKPAAKKATTKKVAVSSVVEVQFSGKSYSTEDLVKITKDIWKYDHKGKVADFKSVEIYVKPEENLAYYVINKEVEGSFPL